VALPHVKVNPGFSKTWRYSPHFSWDYDAVPSTFEKRISDDEVVYEFAKAVLGWGDAELRQPPSLIAHFGSGGPPCSSFDQCRVAIKTRRERLFFRLAKEFGPWTRNDQLMLAMLEDYDPSSQFLRDMHARHRGAPSSVDPNYEKDDPDLLKYANASALNAPKFSESGKRRHRIAFAIMAHQDASTLKLMFQMVYRSYHFYVIHIDLSAGDGARDELQAYFASFQNVLIVPKTKSFACNWGDISLVYAEIAVWIHALREFHFDHLINLSVYDWPIKPLSELEDFLASPENRNVSFQPSWSALPNRYQNVWMKTENFEGLMDWPNSFLRSGHFWKRQNIKKIYGGSQWHMFAREHVHRFMSHPLSLGLLFSLKYTMIPDESYYSTVIRYVFTKDEVRNTNYRFLVWHQFPRLLRLGVDDIDDMDRTKTKSFIARKVHDPQVRCAVTRSLLDDSDFCDSLAEHVRHPIIPKQKYRARFKPLHQSIPRPCLDIEIEGYDERDPNRVLARRRARLGECSDNAINQCWILTEQQTVMSCMRGPDQEQFCLDIDFSRPSKSHDNMYPVWLHICGDDEAGPGRKFQYEQLTNHLSTPIESTDENGKRLIVDYCLQQDMDEPQLLAVSPCRSRAESYTSVAKSQRWVALVYSYG
jgi:Core-2/I-Branching enzyme